MDTGVEIDVGIEIGKIEIDVAMADEREEVKVSRVADGVIDREWFGVLEKR